MKRICVVIFGMIISSLAVVGVSHALEFQTDPSGGATNNPVTLRFEFGSTLNITTTSDSIAINGLVPGTSDISSNGWAVTVSTNNRSGYTLSATVGCSSGEDCYDSKNLSDGTNNFSMLSATGALTSGTWGVSLDSSATKNSNFQPLAKYDETATIINQTTNASGTAATGYSGTANTTVRIGAYAAANQPTGTYTNVINFIAVANVVLTSFDDAYSAANKTQLLGYYKMQDMNSSICSAVTEGEVSRLIDNRDNNVYHVAKLADGNCWMTQNLDHDIVTTSGFYTYANTDIGHGATPNTSAAWTADTATYATNDITWIYTTTELDSYDPGNLCWNGTIRNDFNGTIATDTIACGNDKHYHIGNYYNWTAAVAMNDSSSYTTDLTDVDQSICPAGWRLPTKSGNKSYDNLVTTLSLTSGASGNVQNTPVYFVYGGRWGGASYAVGGGSDYWSSVVTDDDAAYEFSFDMGGYMYPQGGVGRNYGNSVRCVAR